MNADKIRTYEDKLLSKERGIKIEIVVIGTVMALAIVIGILFPLRMAVKSPSDMELFRMFVDNLYRAIGWFFVLALLIQLNRNQLRHIASITFRLPVLMHVFKHPLRSRTPRTQSFVLRAVPGIIVYGGSEPYRISEHATAIPWKAV